MDRGDYNYTAVHSMRLVAKNTPRLISCLSCHLQAEFEEISIELEAVNRRLAEQKANLQSLVAKTERMSAKFSASGEAQE